jgi:hypothetical protein
MFNTTLGEIFNGVKGMNDSLVPKDT